jgi:hypothetical protein
MSEHPSRTDEQQILCRLQCLVDGHFEDLTAPGWCLCCGERTDKEEQT